MRTENNSVYSCTQLILTNLLLFLLTGCGDEKVTLETTEESPDSPPKETSEIRYDLPVNPGFSPHLPVGHCLVLAGFEKNSAKMFFSDPADNLKTGHQRRASFRPHPVRFINNFLTTVVNETPATVTGAVVVQPPDRAKRSTQTKWKQFGMPDFSQHAVSEWKCYCAPTSAADVLTFFSTRYPPLHPRQAFASESPRAKVGDWFVNRMISGSESPLPKQSSLAALMGTTVEGGTSMNGIRDGVIAYLNRTLGPSEKDWMVTQVLEDEDNPDGPQLWNKLCDHCSAGDGILLCILWGVPAGGGGGGSTRESVDSTSDSQSESENEDSSGNGEIDGAGKGSSSRPRNSPDGKEPPIPEENFPEKPNPDRFFKPKEEIVDRSAVIVDEFNLEERDGIWHEKGKDLPFTGKARRSYPNGNKLMEIPYLDGRKHGRQVIWREDGKVLRGVEWSRGKTIP